MTKCQRPSLRPTTARYAQDAKYAKKDIVTECGSDEGWYQANGKQFEAVVVHQGMLVFQIVRLPCSIFIQ